MQTDTLLLSLARAYRPPGFKSTDIVAKLSKRIITFEALVGIQTAIFLIRKCTLELSILILLPKNAIFDLKKFNFQYLNIRKTLFQ